MTPMPAAQAKGAVAPIEFETSRLVFQVWQDHHRAPLAAMNADPEVMRYFPALQSAEQSNASIDRWLMQFEQRGWSNWAVTLRQTGAFIGFIGLSVPLRPMPFGPCVEIGWRLKRAAWGQGYATEGAIACLGVGFDLLGLDEIVSFTTLGNQASRRVMVRLGMTDAQADFDHPALEVGHPLRPHCLYKLSRAQWPQEALGPACSPASAPGGAWPSGQERSAVCERIMAFYAAINRQDMDGMAAHFADDVLRTEPEGFDTCGTYQGRQAVTEAVRRGRSTWAEGSCQPEAVFVMRDQVVVFLRAWVRLHGATTWTGGRFADGFVVRQGKLTEYRTFWQREEALRWANISVRGAQAHQG